jgi:hypothetical protein
MKNALATSAPQKRPVPAHIAVPAAFRLLAIVLVSTLLQACGRTTKLDLEAEWFAAPGAQKQVLTIRSREQQPFTIRRIVINGEFTVQEMSGFQVERFRETTLTIGEAAAYSLDYSKRILYADIQTDRGTCRYEFNSVEPL